MITLPRACIAILLVGAVLAILIAPAFDGPPGTAPHVGHRTVTLASVFLSWRSPVRPATAKYNAAVKLPALDTDVLTLQCTRLC